MLFSFVSSYPPKYLKTLPKEYKHQFRPMAKHCIVKAALTTIYSLRPCYIMHIQHVTVTYVASVLQFFKIILKVDIYREENLNF